MKISILTNAHTGNFSDLQLLFLTLQEAGHELEINNKPALANFKVQDLFLGGARPDLYDCTSVHFVDPEGHPDVLCLTDSGDIKWYCEMIKSGKTVDTSHCRLLHAKRDAARNYIVSTQAVEKMRRESLAPAQAA